MTAATTSALAPDIEAALRRLKLAAVRRLAAEVLQTARTQRWPPEELLRTLLEAELAARDASNARARLRVAGFPVSKSLDEFQVASSSVPRATFDYLASLEWIGARENLVLVGPAGTGKSHLLVALGLAAVEAGSRVRYFAAVDLVETLYRGSPTTPWAASSRASCAATWSSSTSSASHPWTMPARSCCSVSWRPPTSGARWGWPPTGPSSPGVASCPSTPPRCHSSTASSTTLWWSSPRASPSACARPGREGVVDRRSPDNAQGWGLLMATGGDFHMAIDSYSGSSWSRQPLSQLRNRRRSDRSA